MNDENAAEEVLDVHEMGDGGVKIRYYRSLFWSS